MAETEEKKPEQKSGENRPPREGRPVVGPRGNERGPGTEVATAAIGVVVRAADRAAKAVATIAAATGAWKARPRSTLRS